jgi:ribosomal protein S18 acetylase RimI-like enzyme
MNQITAATLSEDALVAAFNLVYTDYIVPAVVNAAWLRQHVALFDIDLERSPVWLDDDGSVVGLSFLGIRDDRGWVGGFGIAPQHRGQGASHGLIQAVLASARAAGLRQVQLEVIIGNDAAVRTYERAGFEHQRDLLVLTRPAGPLTIDVDTTAALEIAPAALIPARDRMPASPPVWQREPRSLAHAANLNGLLVGDPAAPLALCLYRATDTAVRLADIAALDAMSAQTLLAALIEREPDQPITIVNEPEGSEALPALLDAGWVEDLRQHEMLFVMRDA